MGTNLQLARTSLLLLAVCLASCDGDGPGVDDSCVPGHTISCTCGDESGTRVCLPSGNYGDCSCEFGDVDAGMPMFPDTTGRDVSTEPDLQPSLDTRDVLADLVPEIIPDVGEDTEEPEPTTIGPQGGELVLAGIRVVIPAGALTSEVEMSLVWSEEEIDHGHEGYTPMFELLPDGVDFRIPATVHAEFDGDEANAALFWSRASRLGCEWQGGSLVDGVLVQVVEHTGFGFVGDGVRFSETAERSCVRSRILDLLTTAPSAVAVLAAVNDCNGNPLTGLTAGDFELREDGVGLGSDIGLTVLSNAGLQIFVSLVLDMSSSTADNLDALIDGSKRFVHELQVEHALPVQVAVLLFSGSEQLDEWQSPSLDPGAVTAALDSLADYSPADPASTNLHGAILEALGVTQAYQSDFEARNFGGAVTSGYTVVFTDGRDTSGLHSFQDAYAAVGASPVQVAAVGLHSESYDDASLLELAPAGLFTASDASALGVAFGALGNRVAAQVAQPYLLGYCSPKRGGNHTLALVVEGASNGDPPQCAFSAEQFEPGCSPELFAQRCEDKGCGGFACGACDDRLAACNTDTFSCDSFCDPCGEPEFVNPNGYEQRCQIANCDDDDPCTVDVCSEGACSHSPVANDCGSRVCGPSPSGCYQCGACDDANACTDDVCADGVCQYPPVPNDCGDRECGWSACGYQCGTCEDGDSCTDDVCTDGACSYPAIANDCGARQCGMSPSQCYQCGSCDDEDACTDNVCNEGFCSYPTVASDCGSLECGSSPSGCHDCGTCNDGDSCTTDQCVSGSCSFTLIPNDCGGRVCGSSVSGCHDCGTCDDGDPCTDNVCTAGACSYPLVANDCGAQECGLSACGHDCGTCNDNNACTADSCNAGTCQFTALPNDCGDYQCGWSPSGCFACGTCSDGDPCTSDVCTEGVCSYPAVTDDCGSRVCGLSPCGEDCGTCDDGDACTDDVCTEGACSYPTVANDCGARECGYSPSGCHYCGGCNDGDDCTIDACESDGSCSHTPVANDCGSLQCGTSPSGCYECGACGELDGCVDGVCVPGGEDMVRVSYGYYWMGCASGDDNCGPDEYPYHQVYVPSFWIDRTEVTNLAYAAFLTAHGNSCGGHECVDADGSQLRISPSGGVWSADSSIYEDYPVVHATWYGAREYCSWLGKRLCSESEWEKAARGTDGRLYPWGDSSPACSSANFTDCNRYSPVLTDISAFCNSPYGGCHMGGNVWEWVEDDWHDSYGESGRPNDGSAWFDSPTRADERIIRGASFTDAAWALRAANRYFYAPSESYINIGLRCCR